jgi:hypothetical protein
MVAYYLITCEGWIIAIQPYPNAIIATDDIARAPGAADAANDIVAGAVSDFHSRQLISERLIPRHISPNGIPTHPVTTRPITSYPHAGLAIPTNEIAGPYPIPPNPVVLGAKSNHDSSLSVAQRRDPGDIGPDKVAQHPVPIRPNILNLDTGASVTADEVAGSRRLFPHQIVAGPLSDENADFTTPQCDGATDVRTDEIAENLVPICARPVDLEPALIAADEVTGSLRRAANDVVAGTFANTDAHTPQTKAQTYQLVWDSTLTGRICANTVTQ